LCVCQPTTTSSPSAVASDPAVTTNSLSNRDVGYVFIADSNWRREGTSVPGFLPGRIWWSNRQRESGNLPRHIGLMHSRSAAYCTTLPREGQGLTPFAPSMPNIRLKNAVDTAPQPHECRTAPSNVRQPIGSQSLVRFQMRRVAPAERAD